MIQAILFDIETLMNVKASDFMKNYLGILAPRFAHLLSPDKFSKQLLKSIETMQIDPKPGVTNIQVFFDDFCKVTGQSFQVLKPIFEEFYTSDFPALKCLVQVNPQGIKVVDYVIQQGFLTAVASNPVIPLSAIWEQVRWIGLNPDDFKAIPAIDNFHYCKPHPGFFREVAESLGVQPEGCLVVSEHMNDVICRELGMKMFYIGTPRDEDQTDFSGHFDELYRLISQREL